MELGVQGAGLDEWHIWPFYSLCKCILLQVCVIS